MKKAILTLIVAGFTTAAAFGQGTVSLQNFSGATGLVYTNDLAGHSGLVTGNFTVQILFGQPNTALGSLTPGVIFNYTTAVAGKFFDASTITLTGITAGSGSADPTLNVAIAIQGWTGNAASYSAAVTAGAFTGKTTVFNNPTGGGGTPAANPANLVDWLASNNLVLTPGPEPTTIAFAGLGLGAFLIARRRKA
jgi:hypothetical protein